MSLSDDDYERALVCSSFCLLFCILVLINSYCTYYSFAVFGRSLLPSAPPDTFVPSRLLSSQGTPRPPAFPPVSTMSTFQSTTSQSTTAQSATSQSTTHPGPFPSAGFSATPSITTNSESAVLPSISPSLSTSPSITSSRFQSTSSSIIPPTSSVYSKPGRRNPSSSLVIGAAISVVVLLLFLIALVVWRRRRRSGRFLHEGSRSTSNSTLSLLPDAAGADMQQS